MKVKNHFFDFATMHIFDTGSASNVTLMRDIKHSFRKWSSYFVLVGKREEHFHTLNGSKI